MASEHILDYGHDMGFPSSQRNHVQRYLRAIMLVVVILCLIWAFWTLFDRRQRGLPLEIDDALYTTQSLIVSEIQPTTSVEHGFRLRNRSDSVCEVRFDRSSCSCGRVMVQVGDNLPEQLLKDGVFLLERGEQGLVTMAVNPRNHGGLQVFRLFLTAQEVGSKKKQSLSLATAVPVRDDVTITPPIIAHELKSHTGEPLTKTVVIEMVFRDYVSISTKPAILRAPQYLSPIEISESMATEIEAGLWCVRWEMKLRLDPPDGGTGEETESLEIQLPGNSRRRINCPVTVRSMAGIRVFPNPVNFGLVDIGEAVVRRVLVTSDADQQFELSSARALSSRFEVRKIGTMGARGNRHWVEVEFKAHTAGSYTDELSIVTNNPTKPTMKVTMSAVAQ